MLVCVGVCEVVGGYGLGDNCFDGVDDNCDVLINDFDGLGDNYFDNFDCSVNGLDDNCFVCVCLWDCLCVNMSL